MAFSHMTPYVRQRGISHNLNHLGEPLNPVRVGGVFYRRRLIVSTLTPQWLQAHGNRRVPSPVLLVVTNRLGDLLAVVRSPLNLPEAEGGVAFVARSPPVVLISLNDNYCLNVHTAPNSVKKPNVGFVPRQDFVLSVQNVNFVSINTRPLQKKGVSPPVNLKNVSIKDVNFIHISLSVCSSCSCKDECCLNSSNNVASKLSQTRFKSIKRSFSALGSPEAKIQTGTQSQSSREACILKSCCDSCTFCSYRRHVFQGSVAFRKRLFPAKTCRRCFFCKTVRFCDQCKRCSGCCNLSSCRGQAAGVLADLGLYGSQSMGGVHFKERLHPPFSDKASSRSGTFDSEPLRDFCQAEPFTGVVSVALSKTSRRTGTQPVLPRVLQPPLFGSIRLSLQQGEWVTSLNFNDAYFHIPINQVSRKYLRFHLEGQTAISSLAIRPLHRSYGVHHCGQGGKAHGSGKGNLVTPVPRRLLIRSQTKESCSYQTQALLTLCQELGWVMNLHKSELDQKQVFDWP